MFCGFFLAGAAFFFSSRLFLNTQFGVLPALGGCAGAYLLFSYHYYRPTAMATKKQETNYYKEGYRDGVATIDTQGRRIWVYPTKPSGKFYNYRKLVSYLLIAILFAGPFITIGGQPLLMFNILERKFVIFGQLFVPQDFYIFVMGMIITIVIIVLFTVAFGRIWCGWTCPQTVFMEMVFRRIEYWIEGDAGKQKALNRAPWTSEKIRKKVLKHTIFALISFAISNMFLGYIVGGRKLMQMVTSSPSEHWTVFVSLAVFTGVFYYVFAFFREQACTSFCPYGRLQGIFLDKDSINITYDYIRGEPRGKLKRKQHDSALEAALQGDCIDCLACVKICPTGIDIRNGTQMECVNCTACIDACDDIMDKIDKPRGLIRYASENEISQGKKFRFTLRMYAYSGVLLVLFGVLGYMLTARTVIETTILRAPGQMYQLTDDKKGVRNLYTIQIVNKSAEKMKVELRLLEPEGKITMVRNDLLEIEPEKMADGAFFLEVKKSALLGLKTKVRISVQTPEGEKIEEVHTTFVGPGAGVRQ